MFLDERGHCRIGDFGLATMDPEPYTKYTRSIVPPEVFTEGDYGFSVDYWALGILIVKMLVPGISVYTETRREDALRDAEEAQQVLDDLYGEWGFDGSLGDLISKLLEFDSLKRLGHGGVKELMDHSFFEDVDWENVESGNVCLPSTLEAAVGRRIVELEAAADD